MTATNLSSFVKLPISPETSSASEDQTLQSSSGPTDMDVASSSRNTLPTSQTLTQPPTSILKHSKVDSAFELTVDMMVNDFDDEQTLEEEEALAAQEAEDPSTELNCLHRESEIPIDELIAMYYSSGGSPTEQTTENRGTNRIHVSEQLHSIDEISRQAKNIKSTIETQVLTESLSMISERFENENENQEAKDPSKLRELYRDYDDSDLTNTLNAVRCEDRRLSRGRQQSDEEELDYGPDDDECKKRIMVGSPYQAVIPKGFSRYDDVLPYENEDKLLWDPSRLSEDQTIEYLKKVDKSFQKQVSNECGKLPRLSDDEQSLYLLLQCGHNTEEALRRKRINALPSSKQMSAWSEEECRNFESGVRTYGKNFHTIKHTKVQTRSVGELVQFYYLWKKTERHDIFASKARLDKKKYNLNPGLTDFMDKFLEEQDVVASGGSQHNHNVCMQTRHHGTPPGACNSLLQADAKRTQHLHHQQNSPSVRAHNFSNSPSTSPKSIQKSRNEYVSN